MIGVSYILAPHARHTTYMMYKYMMVISFCNENLLYSNSVMKTCYTLTLFV